MTLTKRLYRFDEVRAALLYCILKRRIEDALFWLEELEDSLYSNEAGRLLFVAWFCFVGLQNMTWLLEWCRKSQTVEGRKILCFQLSQVKERDSSLWWILFATPLVESTSYSIQVWRHKCTRDGEDFWQDIVDASTDERIDEILESLQGDFKTYSLLAKATAVAITTHKLSTSVWSSLTTRDPDTVKQYSLAGLNLRKARQFAIPYDCLFGMCWRGRGADTTNGFQTLSLEDLKTSPYWRTILAPYINSESTTWKSDELQEEFWDTHFPWTHCDHPDEWSLTDRQKSHGPGVDCMRGAPLWRWWKNWVPAEHRWFWGTTKDAVWKQIQTMRADDTDTVLQKTLAMYTTLEDVGLEPKKQKVFLLQETV